MNEILTVKEAAAYLKTHQVTFYRWLKKGIVKGKKIGGQWRFTRENLDKMFER